MQQVIPQLLTTEQTAQMLCLAPHTLAVARSEKTLQIPYIKIGRSVRYRLEDVESYLESRTVDPSV